MKKSWHRVAAAALAATLIASQGISAAAEPANQATGAENGNATVDIRQEARYDAGMSNADGGVMEIVDYNTVTGWAYAVNGQTGKPDSDSHQRYGVQRERGSAGRK